MTFPSQLSLSTIPKFPFPNPKNPTYSTRIPKSTPSRATFKAVIKPETDCVRTYENDLVRLSLNGVAGLDQSLSAASADGGRVATEHIDAGVDQMGIVTFSPGPVDDHSTISTKLVLPARKVSEKARKFKSSLPKDMFSGANSEKILAMTCRQVVIEKLLNFDLTVFVPGAQRNIEDLESPREVTASFALCSSDENVICGIAEAVCTLALETVQREFQHGSRGKVSDNFFNWFSKSQKFASKDASVVLYKVADEVIVENAKSLLDMFNSSRANYTREYTKPTICGWTSAMHSKLEKIGGVEFSKWTSEHVPAYRLEINANRLTNITFEGWKRTSENKLEVLLTHSQMVALADVLDMYLEDVYTLPSKRLSSDLIRSPSKLLHNKSNFSPLGFAKNTLVAGILLISVGAMAKLFLPHLYTSRRANHREYPILSVPENEYEEVQPAMLDASQLEAYCCALVRKLKDFYGWNGDVKFDPSFGAWIGEIPTSLRNDYVADPISQDVSASFGTLETSNDQSSIQEIASYQAVVSSDGRIVGFQPTSGVAVNHWAANPIAKELYGGRELSPGLVEPGLKIKKPENVIVMELLMSLSQDNHFALARLVQ